MNCIQLPETHSKSPCPLDALEDLLFPFGAWDGLFLLLVSLSVWLRLFSKKVLF